MPDAKLYYSLKSGTTFSFGGALQAANPPQYLLLHADTVDRPGAFKTLVDFHGSFLTDFQLKNVENPALAPRQTVGADK